jgi:hypothetical protein
MLGCEHPFGKLLSNAMNLAKKTLLEPSLWFHATDPNKTFVLRSQFEATTANRYNQIGQSALYLGCDEKTAAVERLRAPRSREPIGVVNVRLGERIDVLDLRSLIWGNADPIGSGILRFVADSRFISEPTTDVDRTRSQYRIPQFVADLARKRRFNGILYDSTRPSAYNNPEAAGHNLVVFDPAPQTCVVESCSAHEFGEPDYDVMLSSETWPLQPLI